LDVRNPFSEKGKGIAEGVFGRQEREARVATRQLTNGKNRRKKARTAQAGEVEPGGVTWANRGEGRNRSRSRWKMMAEVVGRQRAGRRKGKERQPQKRNLVEKKGTERKVREKVGPGQYIGKKEPGGGMESAEAMGMGRKCLGGSWRETGKN
jgi:hypothetical protein